MGISPIAGGHRDPPLRKPGYIRYQGSTIPDSISFPVGEPPCGLPLVLARGPVLQVGLLLCKQKAFIYFTGYTQYFVHAGYTFHCQH